MAPFVARQYGPDLYRIMCQIKESLDPAGVLNRGTIITDDPRLHLKRRSSSPQLSRRRSIGASNVGTANRSARHGISH